MQNKFKNFRSFLKGKGYYILLLLCTAAVGVTGYFLLADKEPAAPVETTLNAQNDQATQPTDSTPSASEPAANVAATQQQQTEPGTTGQPPFSLQKPVSGQTVADYSVDRLAYNETTRDWRTHEGIDLSAALGENVLASADGTVYAVYEDAHFGMTVVLHHSDGYSTHYSNLAEDVSVTVGQSVKAGQALGCVGQSAGVESAAQTHVHFALYLDNTPLDPTDYWA